jgi:hypothetical protein
MENEQKAIPKLWYELYDGLTSDIEDLDMEGSANIAEAKQAYTICRSSLEQLKTHILNYTFQDQREEIQFFKVIKPKFQSLMIFFHKKFQIELKKPVGSIANLKHYYRKELFKIKIFFENYTDVYQYYRSGSDLLDAQYFLRGSTPKSFIVHSPHLDGDSNFSTGYDLIISKMLAYEKLADFLNDQLSILDNKKKDSNSYSSTNHKELTWTSSKVAIGELIYALYAFSPFNNTKVEIKAISDYFAKVFNIKIGNIYKIFEELRLRKKNRTAFLDALKQSLIRKMDEDDENSL